MADLQANRETTIPITVTTFPASKKFFVSVELTNLRWRPPRKTSTSWKLDASLYVFPTFCP